ncbi:hypothetical protein [Kibdelosporangium aridum]|uniref:hypothetical protein n=1 Tax=Kibdelosporangium aridum TaxID=2030 RepID=UPI0035EAA1A4
MRSLLAMAGWQIRVLAWPRCLKSPWLLVVVSEDRASGMPRRLGLATRDLPGTLRWQTCALGWLRCLSSPRKSSVLG